MFCPIKLILRDRITSDCEKEKCAWWIKLINVDGSLKSQGCAVAFMATKTNTKELYGINNG